MNPKDRSITKTFRNGTIIASIATIAFIGFLWINDEYETFKEESRALREDYFESQKHLIKNEAEKVADYIEFKRSQTEQRLKQNIKSRTREAYEIAMNLYREHKADKDPAEIEKIIKDALRPIRFNSGRGYYFATRLDGVEILFADRPEMEGMNLLDTQDTQGRFVIRDMIEIVRNQGEDFYQYRWTKPDKGGRDFPKIAYVMHFEPFDWLIGTGEYLDDVENDIKHEVLERIEMITFGKDGYVFAGQFNGLSLSGPEKGKNMIDVVDINGVKIVQELIRSATADGGYVDYVIPQFKETDRTFHKLSYSTGIQDWQWYVGAGVNVDEIESTIRQKRLALGSMVKEHILSSILILAIALAFILLFESFFSRRIKKSFDLLSEFFRRAENESITIDQDTLHFSEFKNLAHSVNRMVEERGKAEEALKESGEKYRVLFETANDAIFRIKDGEFIECNNRALEIFGASADQILGKAPTDFSPPVQPDGRSSSEKAAEMIQAAYKGEAQLFEWLHTKHDGAPFHAEVNLNRMRLNDEDYLLAIVRDITERKRAETALEESEERYRTLVESSLTGIYVRGKEKLLFVNQRLADQFGYSREELLGKSFLDLIHPDDRRIAQDRTARRMAGEPLTDPFQFRVMTKDSEVRWVEAVGTLIDYQGEPAMLGNFLDITERKLTEEALRNERDKAQKYLDIAGVILVGIDAEQKVTLINRKGCEVLGCNEKQIVGKNWFDSFLRESMREETKIVFRKLMAGEIEPAEYFENPILTSKGEERLVAWHNTVLKDENGAIIGTLSSGQDITDRRKAEEEARIREQQLIQADKMVTLGTLVAGVAHEVNNPNGFVMMSLPILEKAWRGAQPILDEYHRENGDFVLGGLEYKEMRTHIPSLLSEMKQGCERIKKIVEDLRDFARQRPVDVSETIEINTIAKSAVTLLSQIINKATVKFAESYAKGLPPVRADVQRIEQVMLNLILNSCQALPDKGKGIFLSTSYDEDAQAVVFEIRDEGVGIMPEDLPYITDPFFTTKRETGGTGLGLSVSEGIVEEHGGKLNFSSNPGGGTIATLILPIAPTSEESLP